MPNASNPKKSKALIAADYFIKKQDASSKCLTNKKLQKLLYYAQAWSLVLKDKTIFSEDIEAWVHGPAIPIVYEAFKEFGRNCIQGLSIDANEFSELTDGDKAVLDMVWDLYGKYDGDYLEVLSHSEEPWQKARGSCQADEISRAIITPESMRSFYEQKLKEATAS